MGCDKGKCCEAVSVMTMYDVTFDGHLPAYLWDRCQEWNLGTRRCVMLSAQETLPHRVPEGSSHLTPDPGESGSSTFGFCMLPVSALVALKYIPVSLHISLVG